MMNSTGGLTDEWTGQITITINRFGFTSKNDINKHVWYSISSLVFNSNVDFESAIKIWLDVRYSTFNIQILNVE